MGKVKYNKKTKCFERTILINDIPTLAYNINKEELEKLPYRIYSKVIRKTKTEREK